MKASEPRMDKRSVLGPIVSSAHLASGGSAALSEFEFGLILAGHAFERWMVRCMGAAGHPGHSPLEVLVLHRVYHLQKPKTFADICLVLNIEDAHLVNYALKKLQRAGLVTSRKSGKEKLVSITQKGERACLAYRDIRETMLVQAVKATGFEEKSLSEVSALLRALSGHYDQAARAAASL